MVDITDTTYTTIIYNYLGKFTNSRRERSAWNDGQLIGLPSSNQTWQLKSTRNGGLNRKITYNGVFSIAMFDSRRVLL